MNLFQRLMGEQREGSLEPVLELDSSTAFDTQVDDSEFTRTLREANPGAAVESNWPATESVIIAKPV